MPSSRSERIAFGLGLGLIAVLSALLLVAWRGYSAAPEAAALPPLAPKAVSSPASVRTATSAPTLRAPAAPVHTTAPPAEQAKPVAPAAAPKLRLTAAAGDCWLSVRTGSSTGPEVYVGTLARGKSVSFPLGSLWVRFGAPQNVVAQVGKKRLAVPTGSFNVIFTRAGAKAAPEG